jgi:CIC family chloride channel protein
MLMVGEMTGSYGLLAPAMITTSIAALVVGDRSIYESQPMTRADSPAHRLTYSFPLLAALHVRDAMRPPVLTLRPETPLPEAEARMAAAEIAEAPVTAPDGTLIGLLKHRARSEQTAQTTGEAAIATLSIESDETLDAALTMMAQHRVQRLPVVRSDRPLCLAGMITTEGIVRAYTSHLGGETRRLGAVIPGMQTHRFMILPHAPSADRAIRDLQLPAEVLIVSVERAGTTMVPRGRTVLVPGDVVTVLASEADVSLVESVLQG